MPSSGLDIEPTIQTADAGLETTGDPGGETIRAYGRATNDCWASDASVGAADGGNRVAVGVKEDTGTPNSRKTSTRARYLGASSIG